MKKKYLSIYVYGTTKFITGVIVPYKNAIFVSEKRKITLEIGHPAKNKTLK